MYDVRTYFPVSGDYHFRFQFKHQGQLVWLDLSNDECALPQVDGMIIVKATRKKWTSTADKSKTEKLAQKTPQNSQHTMPKKS